jgi:hypothetical protein
MRQAPTKGGAPGAPALDAIFSEGVPKAGPWFLVPWPSARALDPKTHRKWVWAFIEAIAEQVDVVVSLLYFFAFDY